MKNKNIFALTALLTTSAIGIGHAVMAAPLGPPPSVNLPDATFNSVTLNPTGSSIGLRLDANPANSGVGILAISQNKTALQAQSYSTLDPAINAFGKYIGILAASYDGVAVDANSYTSTAVTADSDSGLGIKAYSGSNTAIQASSAIATLPTITSLNNSTGAAVSATSNSGTGVVAVGKIGVIGSSNTNTGVYGQSNANGIGLEGHTNNGIGVYGGTTLSAGRGGYFVNPSGTNVYLATATSALTAVGKAVLPDIDMTGNLNNPTGTAVKVTDDLQVDGRFISKGALGNTGGMWLDAISDKFMGDATGGALVDSMGFYNSGWVFVVDALGQLSNPAGDVNVKDTFGITNTSNVQTLKFTQDAHISTPLSNINIEDWTIFGDRVDISYPVLATNESAFRITDNHDGVLASINDLSNGVNSQALQLNARTGIRSVGEEYGIIADHNTGASRIASGSAGLFRKYSPGGSTNIVRLSTDTRAIDADGVSYFSSDATGSTATVTANLPAAYNGNALNATADNTGAYALYANNAAAGTSIYARSGGGDALRAYSTGAGNAIQVLGGEVKKPGGGSWTATSDIRLKDVQAQFTRSLDALMKLNPIQYNYKKNNIENLPSDKTYIGLSAQEVQKAIPEAVSTDTLGYLQVNNDPIIFTMLNAVKELFNLNKNNSEAIARLEKENMDLKVKNEQMEARLEKLETALSKLK